MNISLLDLKAQYATIKEEIDKAVSDVLTSGKYVLGPQMKAFEEEVADFCGVKHAISVGNGTDALVLALKACRIGPGDEVITSPFTFFASAESIASVGATPVFAEIDPVTLNIDVNRLEERITTRTKAIIPVHIFGQMAQMDKIMSLSMLYGLSIIEDAAQAIGAEYKGNKAGSVGHAGTFSFFPTKNLGGYGDGGMVVTNSGNIAEKVRMLRFHGCKTKYYHDEIGYNSRLDELQAAILRVKLKYLEQWNEQRRAKAQKYDELLAGLEKEGKLILPGKDPDDFHVYHLFVLRTDQREKLMKCLDENGISNAIYYPVPLHLQKAFNYLGYRQGDLPIAEKACLQAMAIPCYPELTDEQQEKIAEVIIKALS